MVKKKKNNNCTIQDRPCRLNALFLLRGVKLGHFDLAVFDFNNVVLHTRQSSNSCLELTHHEIYSEAFCFSQGVTNTQV